MALAHLPEVQAKMKELRELERGIADFVESCNVQCMRGRGANWVICDDLMSDAPAAVKGRCA